VPARGSIEPAACHARRLTGTCPTRQDS
jgi:hypothetical protein